MDLAATHILHSLLNVATGKFIARPIFTEKRIRIFIQWDKKKIPYEHCPPETSLWSHFKQEKQTVMSEL